jgi:hypothetical protein
MNEENKHTTGNKPMKTDTIKLRLTLDVDYKLNGETKAAMEETLHALVTWAANNGLLTGESKVEIISYCAEVAEQPITYFASDGNYGTASGIVMFNTMPWSLDDWDEIDDASDNERVEVAEKIAAKYQ